MVGIFMDPNPRAGMGGNMPPDPLDAALEPFGDVIAEAENWLDGQKVETEDQMKAVDALLADIKSALKVVGDAEKGACLPLHDAWKAEKARWKPTLDDLDRIKKGLAGLVSSFKVALAAKKEAELAKAREEARRLEEEAKAAAAKADATNIEEARAADLALAEAKQAAREIRQDAREAASVKGLRTVTRYEIDNLRSALHWIAEHDKEALGVFVRDYVHKNHARLYREGIIPNGVRIWTEKEAF